MMMTMMTIVMRVMMMMKIMVIMISENHENNDDEKFCISCVCWVLCEASDDDGASDDNGDFLTIILSQ